MTSARTVRRPVHPRAYAAVIALAAVMLAIGVGGSWRIAQEEAAPGFTVTGIGP